MASPGSGEVAVFTDTNMGTHIAIPVSPDTTAANFKRELERFHLRCFPKSGQIKINGLMVKQKRCFYHLPEALPIKFAFQGLKGAWFLHAEATTTNSLDKQSSSQFPAAERGNHVSVSDCVTTCFAKGTEVDGTTHHCDKKKKKRPNNLKRRVDDKKKECMNAVQKTTVPIDGSIIFNKGDDDCSNFYIRTPPRTPSSLLPACSNPGRAGNELDRTAVGKRIARAANKLKNSGKQRPAISCYRYGGSPFASSMVNISVFEISDSDD